MARAFENNKVNPIVVFFPSHLHSLTQALTKLDLGRNGMGVEGAQYLARIFEHNTVSLIPSFLLTLYIHFLTQAITTLDLSYNGISADGIQYLVSVIENNKVDVIIITFRIFFQ